MREHPVKIFARERHLTLALIAERARVSRMTLHRVIRGGNTTIDLLRRISDATDGVVSVQSLVAASVDSGVASASSLVPSQSLAAQEHAR